MDVWKRKFSPGCCVYSLLQWSKLEKSSDFCELEGSSGVILSAMCRYISHVHFPPPLNSIKVISETVFLRLMRVYIMRQNACFLALKKGTIYTFRNT